MDEVAALKLVLAESYIPREDRDPIKVKELDKLCLKIIYTEPACSNDAIEYALARFWRNQSYPKTVAFAQYLLKKGCVSEFATTSLIGIMVDQLVPIHKTVEMLEIVSDLYYKSIMDKYNMSSDMVSLLVQAVLHLISCNGFADTKNRKKMPKKKMLVEAAWQAIKDLEEKVRGCSGCSASLIGCNKKLDDYLEVIIPSHFDILIYSTPPMDSTYYQIQRLVCSVFRSVAKIDLQSPVLVNLITCLFNLFEKGDPIESIIMIRSQVVLSNNPVLMCKWLEIMNKVQIDESESESSSIGSGNGSGSNGSLLWCRNSLCKNCEGPSELSLKTFYAWGSLRYCHETCQIQDFMRGRRCICHDVI